MKIKVPCIFVKNIFHSFANCRWIYVRKTCDISTIGNWILIILTMIGYNNREKSMEAVLDVSVSSARNASTCFRESGGGSGPTQLCSRATTISQRVTRFFNDFRKVSSNYGRRKAGNGISGLKRARSPARGDAKFSSDCTTVST